MNLKFFRFAPAALAALLLLTGCPDTPAHEQPSADYPLLYTTGRTVYQFHTRTKTGRARSLHDAAPDAWVELSPTDADRHDIGEGDIVRVESPLLAGDPTAVLLRWIPGEDDPSYDHPRTAHRMGQVTARLHAHADTFDMGA